MPGTNELTPGGYGDALSHVYWAAAREGRLLVQRCRECGHHQFYPRPLCLECETLTPEWVEASGAGSVYSLTTVHLRVIADLDPPYLVALVELEEGPRLLTRLVNHDGTPLSLPVPMSWPVDLGATTLCSPAIGEIDGDLTTSEIVITSENDLLHVFDALGNPLPGWPKGMPVNSSSLLTTYSVSR